MVVKKLKRAVIKEELVAIAGDYNKAIILNQFLYWTEKMNDVDEYIKQENRRAKQQGMEPQELTYGWIYKTAEELSEETMMKLSGNSIRNHIKALEKMGFLQSRNNPKYKWDRTLQYRVNLLNIVNALQEKGYTLQGYSLGKNTTFEPQKNNIPFSNFEIGNKNLEVQVSENFEAIPEITTEITNREKKENKKEKKENEIENLFERLWSLYSKKKGKQAVSKKSKQELFKAGYETVAKAIQNYKEECERNKTEEQYIMHGSTFFNGRWEDYVVASVAEETARPASDYYQRYLDGSGNNGNYDNRNS